MTTVSNPLKVRNDYSVSVAYDEFVGTGGSYVYVFYECGHTRSDEMRFTVLQSSRVVYQAVMREHNSNTAAELERFACQYHGYMTFPDIEVLLEPCSWVETNRRDGILTEIGFSNMVVGGIVQYALTVDYDSVYFDTTFTEDGGYRNTVYMKLYSNDHGAYMYKPVRVMYGSSLADPMEVFHHFAVEEFERKNGKLKETDGPLVMTVSEYDDFSGNIGS